MRAQIKSVKPSEGWYGVHTSSITRFLEASRGSQRDFSDAKERASKYEGVKLLFLLLWKYIEGKGKDASGAMHEGTPKQFKYWCVRVL